MNKAYMIKHETKGYYAGFDHTCVIKWDKDIRKGSIFLTIFDCERLMIRIYREKKIVRVSKTYPIEINITVIQDVKTNRKKPIPAWRAATIKRMHNIKLLKRAELNRFPDMAEYRKIRKKRKIKG